MDKNKVILEFDGSQSTILYKDEFLSHDEQINLINELNTFDMIDYPNSTRKMYWLDDHNRNYNFSKVKLSGNNFTPVCNLVRNKVNVFMTSNSGESGDMEYYSSVLITKYPDSHSGLGWHADNEKYIIENSDIVSISLGCSRDFELRRMTENERKWECICTNKPFVHNDNWDQTVYRYKLVSGSLLVMGGSMQKFWYHQVPKIRRSVYIPPSKNCVRYNLTFRKYNNDLYDSDS